MILAETLPEGPFNGSKIENVLTIHKVNRMRLCSNLRATWKYFQMSEFD